MKRIIEVIGCISGLLTIIEWIKNHISNNNIISPLFLICVGICILCAIILLFFRKKETQYLLVKYISYFFRRPNLPYYLKEKKIIYTYKTLQDMKYQKETILVTKVGGISSFIGKFCWSKPQELSKFNVKCLSQHQKLTLGRDTTWYTYTVEFEPAPKGSQRDVNIIIDDLHDPNNEALPFCSASIAERTDFLRIVIALEDNLRFDVDSIKLLVYNNSSSTFPIIEEAYSNSKQFFSLSLNNNQTELIFEEKRPIFGYKYSISWNFR